MKKRIFTEEEITSIIDYYKNNHSMNETCNFFAINKQQLKNIFSDCEVPLRNKEDMMKLKTEKTKNTVLVKYGVTNVFQCPDNIEKKLYNEKLNHDKIQEKIKETKKERYGNENYNNPEKQK